MSVVECDYGPAGVSVFEHRPDGKRGPMLADLMRECDTESEFESRADDWTATLIRTGVTVRGKDRDAVLAVVRAAIQGGAA